MLGPAADFVLVFRKRFADNFSMEIGHQLIATRRSKLGTCHEPRQLLTLVRCRGSLCISTEVWTPTIICLSYCTAGPEGRCGDGMELKRDDWVKTDSGETGKVVHISRLTIFVAIMAPCKEDRMEAFLESQLTKIERPGQSQSSQRVGEGR
jgi:hypothetical protein